MALSLYCMHKRNFFRMVPKGLNAFGSFVHADEIAPDKNFLTFLEPLRMPQNGVFFHLIEKIADFLQNKLFFSDSPEGFALLLGQCAALRRQIAQIRTPF